MKTQFAKKGEVERKWHVVDAEGQILGRLATRVAVQLRGKNKPIFTPNVDTGDFVVVVNAGKVRLTGRKIDQKVYWRHSGVPGGLKYESVKERLEKKPEVVVRDAVRGMLPKNRLGNVLIKKLKVYGGPEHPHSAQKPEPLSTKAED